MLLVEVFKFWAGGEGKRSEHCKALTPVLWDGDDRGGDQNTLVEKHCDNQRVFPAQPHVSPARYPSPGTEMCGFLWGGTTQRVVLLFWAFLLSVNTATYLSASMLAFLPQGTVFFFPKLSLPPPGLLLHLFFLPQAFQFLLELFLKLSSQLLHLPSADRTENIPDSQHQKAGLAATPAGPLLHSLTLRPGRAIRPPLWASLNLGRLGTPELRKGRNLGNW